MKVALVLYGQPRWIEQNPYPAMAYQEQILSKYNTDVYCHSWVSDDSNSYSYGDWVRWGMRDRIPSAGAPYLILNTYSPINHKFEVPRVFELDDISRGKVQHYYNYNLNNENALLSHMHSMTTAINLIDNIMAYDWIIVSRYDAYVFSFPNLHELDNNQLYLNSNQPHFCDLLIFGGPSQMKTQALYYDIPDLCSRVNHFSPEEFKGAAFYKKFEKERRVSIGVGLVRSHNLKQLQL